ncbi:MAG: HD domain-containing protein [Chitinispirillaceae bacterium]
MPMIIPEKVHAWFDHYVNSFDSSDEDIKRNIELKQLHTHKVLEEMSGLCKALTVKRRTAVLAGCIALFHDIGRFEQYTRYRTFADNQSVNHAELGVEVLHRERVLKDFSSQDKDLILQAISFHNRAAIPPVDNPLLDYLSRMIRDADKLDIYRVVTEYYNQHHTKRNQAIEFNLPPGKDASPAVLADLRARRLVEYAHVSSQIDFRLVQLGWVYDINFRYSLRRLKERKYLQVLEQNLPATPAITGIVREVEQYIHEYARDERDPNPILR